MNPRRMSDVLLLRVSLWCITGSVVCALAGLWRVTPLTGLALFMFGTPLFAIGFAGYLLWFLRDLRRHGVI